MSRPPKELRVRVERPEPSRGRVLHIRRMAVAVHEAGHLVAAVDQGFVVHSAMIAMDGRMIHGRVEATLRRTGRWWSPRLLRHAGRLDAIVDCAGRAAQILVDPECDDDTGHFEDYERVWDFIDSWGTKPVDREAYRGREHTHRRFRAVQRAAERIVRRRWDDVLRLAAALLHRGRLTGAEVEEIVS